MEFLVEMTTTVPAGVSAQEVSDVRAQEAAHTVDLASQGRVLRLWRPPLGPGEWRTFGLFAAAGEDDLEQVLASMPLRRWRSDEVTTLAQHPNDPGPGAVPVIAGRAEFLTFFTLGLPPGTPDEAVSRATAEEARRAAELAADGHLIRLWRLRHEDSNLGHWQADDAEQMDGVIASLPMAPWLDVRTVPLSPHPSDPLRTRHGGEAGA